MHIDRVEFICYFSFTEKTNAMIFLTQRIFFVTAMTQLSHTLTPLFSSCIHFAHLLHRCFALARSALQLQTLGNEVPMLYTLLILLAQNYFYLRREASVRMQPAHNSFLILTPHCNTIISCPCTECKNVALGGVDTSFFSLFSTKKHAFFTVFWLFLYFFDLYCIFLRRRDRRERA